MRQTATFAIAPIFVAALIAAAPVHDSRPDARVRGHDPATSTPAPSAAATLSPSPQASPSSSPQATSAPGSPAPTPSRRPGGRPKKGVLRAPGPTGMVINVAIFRTTKLQFKTGSTNSDAFDALAAQLRRLGPIRAWVVDGTCPYRSCPVGDARIYIYGTDSTPAGTRGPGALTFTSFFVNAPALQRIEGVSLGVISAGAKNTVPALTTAQARSLIGHLVVDNAFKIIVSVPSSEIALQLVADPVSPNEPDFEQILENLLAERGIAAVRSSLQANAIRSPKDSTTCPGAQRYFVYRVRIEQEPRKLVGHVRVNAYSEGFILDCTEPGVIPSANGEHTQRLPQTQLLLPALGAFVESAIAPKAKLLPSLNAFSSVVDRSPNDLVVRNSVAAWSLVELVKHMCVRLDEVHPIASSPPPLITAPPTSASSAPPVRRPGPALEPLRCKPVITPAPNATPSPTPPPSPTRGQQSLTSGDIKSRWLGATPGP